MKQSIIVYGQPVSDVVQKHAKIVFNYPKEKIWNQNGVSLKRRLADQPALKKKVDKVLKPENLREYIVPENDSCPTRCIDGRISDGWKPENETRGLGPKVAGGTAHAALAHRVVDSGQMRDKLTFEEDIKAVIHRFKEIGIGFGGHIDDHQSGSNTGCGAVDNINLILDRLQRPTHQEQLRGLAELILGDAYDGNYIVNEVIGRMLYLDALKPIYMPKENNNPDGEFLYKKTIVKTIREQASKTQESVPALTGPHNEIALLLNYIPKTTIDNDKFSHDNDNELQLFAWDVWAMYDEARRLYDYDMDSPIKLQREAIDKRMKYITTRTLLGISTLMVLTDGSLKLIVATPH